MKAVFVHDARYIRIENEIYTELEFSYESWKEYLDFFEHITIIGRNYTPDLSLENIKKYNKCDGPNTSFMLFPSLTNIKNFLLKRSDVYKEIEEILQNADALILRGVQENASLAFKAAKKLKVPIFLEGTGCMWNNTWYYGSLLGKLYAPFRFLNARKVYKYSDAVLYVTEKFLQTRYPTDGISESASDVKLSKFKEDILERRLEKIDSYSYGHIFKIGIIGPLHQKQKGIDNAIKSLALSNINFELHILGRGNPANLKALSKKLKVDKKIFFDGTLPENKVKKWLDSLDIYLQPSRTEGLPRATLEAMSRCLPVITSNAGDLPSIVDKNFVHDRNDTNSLMKMINTMCNDKNILKDQATKNYNTTYKKFNFTTLNKKRKDFLKKFVNIVKSKNA
jgi:glycosyltransferase involved in cell wall biosynthesis